MNKKASVSNVLFVILTLSVATASLLMMYFAKGEVSARLIRPGDVISLYSEEELFRFYVQEALRQSIAETYNEISNTQEYISNDPLCSLSNERIFCRLNPNLKGEFENRVKLKFLTSLNLNGFRSELLKKGIELSTELERYTILYAEGFKLESGNVTFVLTKLTDAAEKEIVVKQIFNFSQEISFDEMGLESFEGIFSKSEECRTKNFKECFKIDDFDVRIEERKINEQEFYQVNMKSNTKFYLARELKPIEIKFLAKK